MTVAVMPKKDSEIQKCHMICPPVPAASPRIFDYDPMFTEVIVRTWRHVRVDDYDRDLTVIEGEPVPVGKIQRKKVQNRASRVASAGFGWRWDTAEALDSSATQVPKDKLHWTDGRPFLRPLGGNRPIWNHHCLVSTSPANRALSQPTVLGVLVPVGSVRDRRRK
jgi:hypothetical protein